MPKKRRGSGFSVCKRGRFHDGRRVVLSRADPASQEETSSNPHADVTPTAVDCVAELETKTSTNMSLATSMEIDVRVACQSDGLPEEVTSSLENMNIKRSFAERVSSELMKRVTLPWITVPQENCISVLYLSRDDEKSVQRRAYFSFDGIVHLSVHRKPITGSLLDSILMANRVDTTEGLNMNWRIFVEHALGILERFKSYEVCIGVVESEFKPLWEIDKLGEVDKNPYGELRYQTTFRPHGCHLLVPCVIFLKRRCEVCIQTKIRFRSKIQRHLSCDALPSTPNVYLDRNQLLAKVQKQKRTLKSNRYQLVKLRAQLQHAFSLNSCEIDESVSDNVFKILMDFTYARTF